MTPKNVIYLRRYFNIYDIQYSAEEGVRIC
jgi:hypothetical protein